MLVNTQLFREEAIRFDKDKTYCKYPRGTYAHAEYWKEQDKRCREGYTVGGVHIPGTYYFYLNFSPIIAKNEQTGRKQLEFARFTDVDLEYFRLVEQARDQKKGLIILKPRRTGFSFKNSRLCVHEYTFFRDSKCIIGAYMSDLSKYTMQMALEGLNFLDKHTEWKKQRNPDTREHVKARYQETIDGTTVWKGYNSEIFTLTFKDNPFASVGKSANIFLFEEAGKFDNLIASYNISEPTWRDGDDMIGIPILYGTGGDMEGGTIDFHKMFYDPDTYNLLALDNIWDDNKQGTKCGWFIPASRMRFGSFKDDDGIIKPMVDENGNSNILLATKSIQALRETKKQGDPKAIRDTITQYPLTPQEAFLRNKGSVFPVYEIAEWLGKVETTPDLRNTIQKGDLYFDSSNKLQWRLDPSLNAITDFPLDKTDDNTGCITIWEHPEQINGQTPPFLYIAGCDPYDQDNAESTSSLGSFFVYKSFISANRTYNMPVAEYTGRPEKADVFYENCRRLCMYYNAKCLYENQLKGLKVHFEMKNSLHYLYETPGVLKDIVKDSRVSRGYGIHMVQAIKQQCEIYLKQWLLEERKLDNGETILNLHTILSVPLLKELLAYDEEGNYDRAIAFMLCILQTKENHRINLEHMQETYVPDPFWNKPLFRKHTNRF